MSFESVRTWLATHAPDVRIIDAHDSTATVADAAATLGVEPARIAKTLTVRAGETIFLLVTRGEEGMSLFSPERVRHLPALVREVYDVSGAGDTVLATLAYRMLEGNSVEEAMGWAAAAAGVVVGKSGTASLSRAELEEAMHA